MTGEVVYNTGNPVPSADAYDRFDNTRVFDGLLNGPDASVTGRTGKVLKSWQGFEADFSAFLLASGYEFLGNYDTDGPLLIERQNQVFTKDGEYWRPGPNLTLPYTTVGNWAVDQVNFVSAGDAVLRQGLASPTGAGMVGFDKDLGYAPGTVGDALKSARGIAPSVEQFGIVPDGVTNWESSSAADWAGLKAAALTTGVRWPAGKAYGEYYACGLNLDETWSGSKMHFEPGSVMGGVFHLISGGTMLPYNISSASRTSNVVTISTSTPHGFVTGNKVQVRATYQPYTTGIVSINTDGAVVTVTGPSSFTYAQSGPDVVATVSGEPFGQAQCNNAPVRDIYVTGLLTTTDRLGTINCKDCYIESCWVLNDPARHSVYPGTPARGAHLYIGTDGLRIDSLVIDYASGANTAAAFSLDGNGWNPTNCSFGSIYIKDSAYTGCYITGGGHYFGEIRIDGFAKEAPNGEILQDSNGLAQTNQLKGFWVNRCWNTRIDNLFTNQRTQDGTRGYEFMHALIDQVGHPSYNKAESGISIGNWEAQGVRRQGIFIGDNASFDSVNLQCNIETMQINSAFEGLAAGSYLLDIEGSSGQCDVSIGSIRLARTGNNLGIKIGALANGRIGEVHAINHNNQILLIQGSCHVGSVRQMTASSGVPTQPLIDINNSGATAEGTWVGAVDLYTTATKTATVLRSAGSGRKWRVGMLRSRGYRNTGGTVIIDNPNQGFCVDRFDLVGPDSTGIGVLFAGTVSNSYMGGRIQGFAKGLDKGTATFTASSNAAVSMTVSSTVATDLLAASFDKLACTGVTL